MTPQPRRGLPPRLYIPIVLVLTAAFMSVIAYFLHIAYGVTGSAISPTTVVTAQPGSTSAAAPTLEPGRIDVPQSGGAGVMGGGPQPVKTKGPHP